MNIKAAWKYILTLAGIILIIIMGSSLFLFKTKPECASSTDQTIVRWMDEYWPCRRWWSIRCMWPFHRKHSTYRVTVHEGAPLSNDKGKIIPTADGKIREWIVYDAAAWNSIGNSPSRKRAYVGYEPIAENEFVVVVETRYRLFHDVENTLRICTLEASKQG